jgi:hypothetical protein
MAASPKDRLGALYSELVSRNTEIDRNERYLAGEGRLTFATEAWKQENGARFASFSDNWCDPVISAEAERLNFNGVLVRGDDKTSAATQGNRLWDYWLDNDVEASSAQGFQSALVSKSSYVIVWDDGTNTGTPLVTWEHPSNVIVQRDPANRNRTLRALKSWQDDDTVYATLFERDFIYKFQKPRTSGNLHLPENVAGKFGWAERVMQGVEPTVQRNPLGVVPVVEIPNRPDLNGKAQSELTKVIPLQDAINVLWAYLMAAADYASMPARVLLNTDPPMRTVLGTDGKPISREPVTMEQLNQARMAVFNGGKDGNARIDQWDPAQLKPFTEVIEIGVAHIASQTRTPPHYLVSTNGMSNLSADALKAVEIGLVNKTRAFMTFVQPELRKANFLIASITGDSRLIEAARRSAPSWANPEMRSDAQLADAQTKKRSIGLPMRYILEMEGLAPDEIERVMAEIEREKRDEIRMSREFGLQETVNGGFYSDLDEQPADSSATARELASESR